MMQEAEVREMLSKLQAQRDGLQRELWATEGAMAVCRQMLEKNITPAPLRVDGSGQGKEEKRDE